MAFIYVITNDINGKQYVGKTNDTIKTRYEQHLKDRKKRRCEKRPLYSAMNKYGIEHFSVEELEECSPEEAPAREAYWIDKLNTYHYGYNATRGGEGSLLFDYDKIFSVYQDILEIKKTAKICCCSPDTVSKIVRNNNVNPVEIQRIQQKKKIGKKVRNVTKDIIFETIADAARYVQKENLSKDKSTQGISSHIREAANEKGKKAYSFEWEWV